jgi:hypothetical protein
MDVEEVSIAVSGYEGIQLQREVIEFGKEGGISYVK